MLPPATSPKSQRTRLKKGPASTAENTNRNISSENTPAPRIWFTISELKQSKIEFELICVNNGSSDNTELILADLQKRHKEIKILKINKNQGYGWGIITGLNAASGSYIGYTDGDGQVAVKDIVGVLDSLKERN